MRPIAVPRSRAWLGGLVVLGVLMTGCSSGQKAEEATPHTLTPFPQPSQSPTPEPTEPTTSDVPKVEAKAADDTVTKVLVFIEENHSLEQMKSGMPYAFSLAQQFGYATNFVAARHPSLPNYIAIAGGSTYGIDSNDAPSSNRPVRGASVFGQAIKAGKTAKIYADGMPNNCRTSNGGDRYAVRHNPWVYFSAERALCEQFDVPASQLAGDIAAGNLPNVGMVIPNNCNNAHDCSLGNADAWFRQWMPGIFDGPDWKSGHLAIILTADEDNKKSGNVVLTAVIHPSQKGKVVTTRLTHYSLSRLLSEVTGSPPLINGNTAPSMSEAFGLPMP
ncbi:MAG: alkaline phosphatase family protein [Actinomycetota bacterium]|nr:alkaline phosphatase family protein [Actinomycetota bacterium]